MLPSFRKDPVQLQALERLESWTRERFRLSGDAVVLVSELACALPGCPPLETVVAFWTGGRRHHFKVFKPVAAVVLDDVPFAWLMDALAVPDGYTGECC